MDTRTLGRTDLRIPPIIFGSMARQNQSNEIRIEILRTAFEHGLTTIDTAPLYDFGNAERQIALALDSGHHHEVQIFTKVGLRWDAGDYGEVMFEFTKADGERGAVRKDSRPESVRWEVEQSLARLRVESLDLVQIHQADVQTPIDESMCALLDLRAEGKIRHIGVSNFSSVQVIAAQQALGDVPLASVQPEYNLVRRGIEGALLPLCIEHCIGVLAYSPLAEGVLSERLKPGLSPRISKVIKQILLPISARHNVSPSAVALAWVYSQPGISAAICGASTPTQVIELSAALKLELSDAEWEELSTKFARTPLADAWREPGGLTRRARRFAGRILRRLGSV